MKDAPELVLFSNDDNEVEALKARFRSEGRISVVKGSGAEVTARRHLDAIWMTPMMASYFGLNEPLVPHVAKVFPMSLEKRDKGLPRLLIAGVAVIPGRSYSSKYLSTIAASALPEALKPYKLTHEPPILRIGSNPGSLGLDNLDANDAFQAIREAFAVSAVAAPATQSHKTHQVA